MVNTNGLKIAEDDALLALLKSHRSRLEVYLQYDGPSPEASIHHRGADLTRIKERAIVRLSEAGIFTTLVMTAALGVNDGDIGAVVMKALNTPFIGGVAIQPVFGSGRGSGIDPLDRLTHTGVLTRLGPQTGEGRPVARSDRAAVLASALLVGRLSAAGRLRHRGAPWPRWSP